MLWFDAHLDLAYLAVNARDMLAENVATLNASAGGVHPPAAVTLPELVRGNVRLCLATIFTEVGGQGPEGYPAGDWQRAHIVARAQLEAYLTWQERGQFAIDMPHIVRHDPGVGEIRGGMGVSELKPEPVAKRLARADKKDPLVHAAILMENADPIRTPDDLAWWKGRGLAAIGLTWAKSSRYAGGNTSHDGLSDAGRELIQEIDRLGVVHDVSHLSDKALDELLGATDRPVIASHSNCRALLGDPSNQRHLRDETIRHITDRGGVIGLNLFSRFLTQDKARRATIDDCLRHIEHVCELAGSRTHVGLGSDMDGGFSAAELPEGISTPSDLGLLAEALRWRNWSDDEVEGFAHGNWARFFGSTVHAEHAGKHKAEQGG